MAEQKHTAAKPAAPANKTRMIEPAGSGDAGPGTRNTEVPEDTQPRMQTRMHTTAGSAAAPIEAPDAEYQRTPVEGLSRSSNNPVAANAGLATYTGENHVALSDENGKPLKAGSLFEAHKPDQTYRVLKSTVHEVFNYPGSLEPMTRIYRTAGGRVTLLEASRLEQAVKDGEAQREQEVERVKAEEKGDSATVAKAAGGQLR